MRVSDMEAWLTELPGHHVTLGGASRLITVNKWRGWDTQPRAECTCGWAEGAVTTAGMYDLIRRHLRAHGWRVGVVA